MEKIIKYIAMAILFILGYFLSDLKIDLKKAREESKHQAETIELLRGELQKYAAIEQIINSRCLDNLEPVPMEVGE